MTAAVWSRPSLIKWPHLDWLPLSTSVYFWTWMSPTPFEHRHRVPTEQPSNISALWKRQHPSWSSASEAETSSTPPLALIPPSQASLERGTTEWSELLPSPPPTAGCSAWDWYPSVSLTDLSVSLTYLSCLSDQPVSLTHLSVSLTCLS